MSPAEVLSSPTVIAVVVSTTLAAIFVWLNTRGTEGRQRSSQASSQEVTARAEFVRDLLARANLLEEKLDAAQTRERQSGDAHHHELDAAHRRYRQLVGNFVARDRALRRMLQERGVAQLPSFQGWVAFTKDGGEVQGDWLDEEDLALIEEEVSSQGTQKALVLDDDTGHSRIISQMLTRNGWKVECFTSGKLALEALLLGHYDLSIVDLVLPDIDGLEVGRRARAEGYTGAMIAMSGAVGIVGEAKILEAGFQSALGKPARLDSFMEAVRQATHDSSHQ